MLVAGHFQPLFSLARSAKLVFLLDIELIDIKWSGVIKFPSEDNCQCLP